MRAARNLRNLNDNREIEVSVENYRKKKLEQKRLCSIHHMSSVGGCWNTIYYNTSNN